MSGQLDQIEEIFLHAVEIKSPDQRTAFLDQTCADDVDLRHQVDTLIMVSGQLDTFFHTIGPTNLQWGDRSQRGPKQNRIGEITGPIAADLAELLGRRLSRMCLIGTVAIGLFVAALFIQSPYPAFELLLISRLPLVGIVILCGLFSLLVPRNASEKVLRRWEVAIVVTMLAACVFFFHDSAYYPPRLVDFASRGVLDLKVLARYLAVPWVCFVVGYSTLIPTTGRRCAIVAVTGSIVMLIVPYVIDWMRGPTDPKLFAMFEMEMAAFYGVAIIFAVFGSAKLHRLRSAVQEIGQYRLVERIGAGGMGDVFKAEHRFLKRPCVVKMVRQEKASDETFVRRFKCEIAAVTQLQHPAAIQVYDYGQTSDGTLYYVMEYVPGLTLAGMIDLAGPFVPARVVPILRQLCGALAEAHALGLVHRDIKPSNIMLGCLGGRADAVKLLDFGLVAIASGTEERITRTDVLLGTPAYMSPEQAIGARVGPKSDLYSLGAVAYFMLTGRGPFVADHPLKLVHAHVSEQVEPPSTLGVRIPAELESVIMRLLAKAPDDRFSSATEVDAALAHVETTDEWDDADALEWWDWVRPKRQADVPPKGA